MEFGVEWDTNILLYSENIQVNIKTPFYRKGKITFTIEDWPSNENIDDCVLALEVQMGVFNDMKEFRETCDKFMEKITAVLQTQKITAFGREFDVLLFVDPKNNFEGKFYKDCARKIEKKTPGGYTASIMEKNIIGTPQITFGIRLPKVISLFAYISDIYDKKAQKNIQLEIIYATYINSGYFSAEKGITNLEIISFLMLCGYYLSSSLVMKTSGQKAYKKAFFMFKLRTNLRIIYDYLKEPKNILVSFCKYIYKKERSNTMKQIITVFLQKILKPNKGYTNGKIVSKNRKYQKNEKEVKIFLPWWQNSIYEIDYGEWTMKNDKIHLEFRGIPNIMNYITDEPFEKFFNLHPSEFCQTINIVFDDFLNKALEIDPNIIIPE